MSFTNQKILITGGNSGIGAALAEALAARGNRLIITGRNGASLSEMLRRNPDMVGYEVDVTDPDALEAFHARLLSDHPDLDAAILNAGIMVVEDYLADPVPTDIAGRTWATNVCAVIQTAAALLPTLRTRPNSALITVSSGLAFVPLAATPAYCASKAAIHSWTQSVRHQLRETSVSVHEIVPPLVATELKPGQSKDPRAMPLDAFVSEVVAIMSRDVVPDEIAVERVSFHRDAVAEGRFAEVFAAING